MHGKESGRGAYVVKGGMCGEEGGMYGKEGACMAKEDVHGEGGHAWQRVGGMHGRRHGHCSRRYASYWNAFLLQVFFCPGGGGRVSI